MAKPPPTDPVVPTTEITEETAGLDGTPSIIGRVKKYFGFFRQEDKIRPVTLVSALKYNKTTQQFYEHDTSIQKVFEDMNEGTNSTLIKTVLDAMNTYYNKYNITDASLQDFTHGYDDTSQASYTLTATAGHTFIIYVWTISNATRTFGARLYFTRSGGTEYTVSASGNIAGATRWYNALGSTADGGDSLGMDFSPFVLQAGDALKVEIQGFIAADAVKHSILYKDITN